jgi:anti-sigma B factor antagonist
MAYGIEQRLNDGVVILAPRGRLVLGEPVQAFRQRLEELFAESCARIALDLTNVDYIDSSALGCLVFAHTRMQKAGGVISIFGLNQRHMELLVITKLYAVFRIAETEPDAINFCYPDRSSHPFDILAFVEQQRARLQTEAGE